jgi:RNA polymerase sigma-70 factor (ECF subfamily)
VVPTGSEGTASVYRIDAPRSGTGPPPATAGDDEAALVAAAKADRRAFTPLYRRYVDPIYRYCYRRLGNREAAEDATSLVFARALAALPNCREESFRSWLFAIAHNVIANDIRAARPQQPLAEAELLVDSAAGPEDLAIAGETHATVLDVLPRLPADQRRVLELRLAGLSGPEIAAALGRSHGSVRVAQSRAVARLRALLVGPGENIDG